MDAVPEIKNVSDFPARLRSLAEQIENGDYGTVKQLAWIISSDARDGVAVGLLGPSAAPRAEAVLLYTLAIRDITEGI